MKIIHSEDAVSERHVQAIWYDAQLRPVNLRTIRGTPVHVIDPGQWNLEAGPDFRDAVLVIGGERRVGDIEIHLRGTDWVTHGHASDPAYSHVIAHVTWHASPPLVSGSDLLPAGCIRICLGDFLRTQLDFSPDEIDLAAYPYARLPSTPRPCEAIFSHNIDRALALLRMEGERRMQVKARRLKALFIRVGDRAQIFYEEVMSAFGYKQNAASFRALAQTLPWRDMPSNPEAAFVSLSCAAGMEIARLIPWRTSNVRPSNSPHRRLEAAAALFAGRCPDLLIDLAACDLMTPVGQHSALELLRASKALGERRAAAILANVLVPFALAEARIDRVPDSLIPEDVSSPVRLTAFRLLGRDHNPALYAGNGLLIQGLIQLHRDYCLAVHPDCSTCPLAAQPS